MLNTNHYHKTPIPWIPTAQTIDGDVMYQSSDNQLVYPPTWSGWRTYPRAHYNREVKRLKVKIQKSIQYEETRRELQTGFKMVITEIGVSEKKCPRNVFALSVTKRR